MIHELKYDLIELKSLIIKDFKFIDNIKEDFKETIPHNPECTVWFEGKEILGYMCTIYRNDMIFCSYTKAYNKKIIRKMYNVLKEQYKASQELNIPLLTNGDNFGHCKNHVIQYKDTQFFEYKL